AGDLALGAGIEGEAPAGVLQYVGRVGEHRPPIAGRAGGGARFGDRVAVAEEALVHRPDELGLDFVAGDLSESGHGDRLYLKVWLRSSGRAVRDQPERPISLA